MAESKSDAPARKYVYLPEDFPALTVAPLHMDLTFLMDPAGVEVRATTTFVHRGSEPLTSITLDANALKIVSVERLLSAGVACDVPSKNFVAHVASLGSAVAAEHTYDEAKSQLTVQLSPAVTSGSQFSLKLVTICFPNDSVLEGMCFIMLLVQIAE